MSFGMCTLFFTLCALRAHSLCRANDGLTSKETIMKLITHILVFLFGIAIGYIADVQIEGQHIRACQAASDFEQCMNTK
ncbi:hypothetical protein VOWphi5012_090 [Vibrio phage phi50-12]|uniref:Uncharacterized protein n=1 Tax=Vibrio phage phi50-12 TaxID=2654972 RepID=A0A5P8PRE0_9CAUD|nr:hypothetical protein KNU82_gp090 [Vibrio phage phi50-12]QFR59874.1 hypothetical protein VOWphi5012_090 [Vibrio phage phi50-12]